jgi:hypothetical protein
MSTENQDPKQETLSGQGGVMVSDLSDIELKLFKAQCKFFTDQWIASPDKLLIQKILESRYTGKLREITENEKITIAINQALIDCLNGEITGGDFLDILFEIHPLPN